MGELIERSEETAAVDDALSAAAAGSGGSMLVVGQAGIGKSALLGYARHAATAAGFTVLHAVSTPVSTMLSHAVARDWLAPLARRSRPGTRPFDGPAAALAESLTSPATQAGAPTTSWSLAKVDYALRWALEGLAEARPLLLVVDDVHWTDTGSLQLLDLLSARLDARVARLPALLLLAQRTGEPLPSADLVDRLAGRARVLSPRPLSVLGVDRVRRQREPVPAIARLSAQELHRRSGGVPFLLEELLRAPSLEEAPREVVSSVRERLARLGPAATAVARTTAALGDEASFDAVAELTAMSVAELADPLELLADAGIVDLGMWRSRPTHPLVAEAILGSLTPSERSALFSSTADYLASCGRSRHVVASHLLHTLPGEDASVVSLLWDAGAEALAAGNPAAAATYLLRAVGETRPEDTDPELLGLAASAHLAAGLHEEAFDLWERAGRRTSDPVARARLLADVGDARMTAGDRTEAAACHTEAVAVLRAAGHDLSSPAMREALTRTGLPRLFYDGVVGAETLEAAAEARARPREADTRLDRRLFALQGADLVVRSGDRDQAVALALRALGEGALLEEETSEGMGFYLASAVLYWSDAYAEDLVFLDAAVDDARRRGSVLGFATASYTRGMVYERQGRLHAAATEYQAALDLREQGWADFADAAVAGAARVNLALGRRDEALTLEPALRRGAARGRFIGAPTAIVAGMIRASQGDHEQALEDYRRAGRLLGEHRDNGSIAEWRELSACSLHALGLHEEALATAEEAVRHARVWGAPRALGVALLALAEVTLGGDEPAVLREAVATLETAGSLDLLARARLQLAARLTSEASTREEAFALMTEALDYGRGHAVPPVTGQATTMLLRAGQPVEDGDVQPVARLTPGERRVAELAAAGDTNRQIAEKLFVTVKAVEWHLSNTYRKLEISSRSELAVSLYGDPGPSSSSLR